ncbi:hypothetical protein NP493_304g02025 [Ridgeia piscesae]|uniref:Uncharacterized protein n=1 Tax=Ridgeia piscesae TaxID=27915 RepID=A0AAD9L587_RIDPI|nr:hypothetical protein NP493_304g02025 [Ridgeia piscesae]
MPQDSIPKVALRWTPPGKRKRGRPKMTWRQSVMAELKEMGLSWGEAQASAKDRTLWRSIVVALCPTGDEEDKQPHEHFLPAAFILSGGSRHALVHCTGVKPTRLHRPVNSRIVGVTTSLRRFRLVHARVQSQSPVPASRRHSE